ncbi:glycosyltransferase family 2 protein [Hymenobacter sp. 102]|uniref:glycosyltransferase family 2 protein n=1 Tax=Hymenobacter sp. 102 TaxID=3403152 RepID=UPI003CE7DD6D
MQQAPFFSVVIPTYNRADFITATVQSVLAQQFAGLEVLIVDDGSTDATAQVVQPLLADARVQYLPKQNAERGAARNYGFARATGEYVLFLDSDDLWLPHYLTVLHQEIEQQQQPNFIACKFVLDRGGRQVSSDLAPLPAGRYGLPLFLHGNPLACNFAVRRQNPQLILFEEDRQYASVEDWMFLLQNMQQDQFYLVDDVAIVMNDHDARSMRADHRTMTSRWLKLPQWIDAHLQLSVAQRRQLLGHIYYLCAIHAYAAGAREESLQFAWKAAGVLPKSKAAILLLRCLAGVSAVDAVKKLVVR